MDKKRKKFGLSLKTTKKLTVEKKSDNECGSRFQTQSILYSKERAESNNLIVIDSDNNLGLTRKVDGAYNSLQQNNIETKTSVSDEERERLLWKSLFPLDSTDWKDLELLPNLENYCNTQDMDETKPQIHTDINDNRTENNNILSRTVGPDSLNTSQDIYVDLPKPCIPCYTRKPIHLEYSQEKKLPNQSTENQSNSHLNHDSNIAHGSSNYSKTYEMEELTIPCIKHNTPQDKYSANNRLSHGKTVKSTSNRPLDGAQKEKNNTSSIMSLKASSTSDIIDLTDDIKTKQRPNRCNIKLQRESDNVIQKSVNTKKKNLFSRTSNLKYTNPSSQSTSLVSLNNGIQSQKHGIHFRGIHPTKDTSKKEGLKCCPMCQLQFPQRMNKQDIDKHISSCIGDEIIIDDDEDEDW